MPRLPKGAGGQNSIDVNAQGQIVGLFKTAIPSECKGR